MVPDPASVKAETRHAAPESGLPGRFRLVYLRAPSEYEKVQIDLVDGAAIRLICPAGVGFRRRGGVTLRHVLPEVRGGRTTGSIICRDSDSSGHWTNIQS